MQRPGLDLGRKLAGARARLRRKLAEARARFREEACRGQG